MTICWIEESKICDENFDIASKAGTALFLWP
jgi:hypothetical protein